MRKIYPLVLVILLLFQSIGLVWWFKLEHISIQIEMQEKAKKPVISDIVDINLPLSIYLESIIDEGKELKFEGKMFDIVSVKIKNGRAAIKAIRDSKEENVLLRFSHFIKHSNSNQKQVPQALSNLFLLFYLSPGSIEIDNLIVELKVFCVNLGFASKTYFVMIDSPPPKVIS